MRNTRNQTDRQMKLKHCLSMLLLAVCSVFRLGAREECHNEVSTIGTHANGIVPLYAEEAITTRYLLVKKGTAADEVLINAAANTRPLGVCQDEPAIDTKAAIAILGAATGTLKIRCKAACTAGAKVYSTVEGKVTGTYASGAFCVGIALNTTTADGDLVEVAHMVPILDASGTAL